MRQVRRYAVHPKVKDAIEDLRTGAVILHSYGGDVLLVPPVYRIRNMRPAHPSGQSISVVKKRELSLHIEVQLELPRVGAEPDRVYLRAFVLDPDIDHILGEDASLKQELVICLERVNGLFK